MQVTAAAWEPLAGLRTLSLSMPRSLSRDSADNVLRACTSLRTLRLQVKYSPDLLSQIMFCLFLDILECLLLTVSLLIQASDNSRHIYQSSRFVFDLQLIQLIVTITSFSTN